MKIIDRFGNLDYNPFTMTWLNNSDKRDIWLNYLFNHSGSKEESPLIENFIFNDFDESKLTQLTNIIDTMFNDKWNRLHDALTLEYGVIDNYNRIEDTDTLTSDTNTNTGSHSNTDIMTGGRTNTRNNTVTNTKSAYDSETFVNNDKDTESGTDVLTYDAETKTTTGNDSNTENKNGSVTTHSEIKGNIGVTTSQQMITSEIELRRFNLINEIYNDLDSLLTIGVYVY